MLLAPPALVRSTRSRASTGRSRRKSSERLKRQISQDTRSSIEALGVYHYESGDLNNRLDFFRAGAGLNYNGGLDAVYVNLVETRYLTQDADYSGWARTSRSARQRASPTPCAPGRARRDVLLEHRHRQRSTGWRRSATSPTDPLTPT